jgi:hypothetical protein
MLTGLAREQHSYQTFPNVYSVSYNGRPKRFQRKRLRGESRNRVKEGVERGRDGAGTRNSGRKWVYLGVGAWATRCCISAAVATAD